MGAGWTPPSPKDNPREIFSGAQPMTPPSLDILGIGHAIVAVLARAEDSFLAEHGMAKGGIALLPTYQAHAIHRSMCPGL